MIDTLVPLPRRSPARGPVRAVLLPVLGLALVIGGWWLAVILFGVEEIFLPTPGAIVATFVSQPKDLLDGVLPTIQETLGGFAVAIPVGLIIALAIAASRTLNQMFYPLVVAANAIPKLALAPLVVTALGIGLASKVVVVFLVCFFPIVVSSYAGFASTPADLAELARSLSASRLQTFLKVRFPAALPQIFVGMKVAAALATIGAVVGEFAGTVHGLGNEVFAYSGQGRTSEAFGAVILLSVVSVALFYLVVLIERLVVPWAARTTG
jgi:NitT/TauT family transport system permease protein